LERNTSGTSRHLGQRLPVVKKPAPTDTERRSSMLALFVDRVCASGSPQLLHNDPLTLNVVQLELDHCRRLRRGHVGGFDRP